MQSNKIMFIIACISTISEQAYNKYSIEYLLIVIIQNLAALAYCEIFSVIITTIRRLNDSCRINTKNSIYSICLKIMKFQTDCIKALIIIILIRISFCD